MNETIPVVCSMQKLHDSLLLLGVSRPFTESSFTQATSKLTKNRNSWNSRDGCTHVSRACEMHTCASCMGNEWSHSKCIQRERCIPVMERKVSINYISKNRSRIAPNNVLRARTRKWRLKQRVISRLCKEITTLRRSRHYMIKARANFE